MAQWLAQNPAIAQALQTIIVAILVAVLSLLGYDVGVVQPRLAALRGSRSVGSDAAGDLPDAIAISAAGTVITYTRAD